MKFAIIANPKAGRMNADQKRIQLKAAGKELGARVYGLNTGSPERFVERAMEVSAHCDVLIVAGGDGTFASVVNAIYPNRLSLAYLPLGTGNALRHALSYRGKLLNIARHIRNGRPHTYDLIRCDGKRLAFMASVGLDGTAVRLWTRYRQQGVPSHRAYLMATLKAYLLTYRPGPALCTIDATDYTIDKLLSLAVMKQPYFGMGMKIAPHANWSDGQLHAVWLPARWHQSMISVATSFTIGNRAGTYRSGKKITVTSKIPLTLQVDGELGMTKPSFSFEVVPKALTLWH